MVWDERRSRKVEIERVKGKTTVEIDLRKERENYGLNRGGSDTKESGT